jgi:hypothetical protein
MQTHGNQPFFQGKKIPHRAQTKGETSSQLDVENEPRVRNL